MWQELMRFHHFLVWSRLFLLIILLWMLTPVYCTFLFHIRKNATPIPVTGTVLHVPLGSNHGRTVQQWRKLENTVTKCSRMVNVTSIVTKWSASLMALTAVHLRKNAGKKKSLLFYPTSCAGISVSAPKSRLWMYLSSQEEQVFPNSYRFSSLYKNMNTCVIFLQRKRSHY